MVLKETLLEKVPPKVKSQLESYADAISTLFEVRDPRVLSSIGPSAVRGTILKRGKQGVPTQIPASHRAYFDWSYPHDFPEMAELYDRAKRAQWNGDDLPWDTSVDPLDPNVPLVPDDFFAFDVLEEKTGLRFDADQRNRLRHDFVSWILSQFLHGEQGALFAAAQVTEAVQFFDGKLYGATQVVDEGRHVEVFHRYLDTKLERLYQINDNLFVIIDALMQDGRWDMKFLGMQIMVEGVALGAFGTLYRETKEPLLKALLRNVIQDESRHVHYGVLALREHVRELTERERREREDWAFEVALLMRNRFLAYEIYEEHFEGIISRKDWREAVYASRGMERFRHVMFSRMVPNLREIGLLSERIRPHYARVGLDVYFGGLAADRLSGEQLLADLDHAA
ncbi:MAG TPA: ferritin-like domain-containing protein [Sandaracinaceae bacterium]